MFRSIPVAVAILLMSGATAQAEDDPYERSGPYIGAAGTWAFYTQAEDDLEDEDLGSPDVENPLGINFRAGYRFYPAFAAELEFDWLAKSDIEFSGLNVATLDAWVLTANAKGYILNRLMHDFGVTRVQPFALAGLGLMQAKVDDELGLDISQRDESLAVRVGLGVDVYITPDILSNLDFSYVIPTNADVNGLDFLALSLGFQFRF